MPKSSRKFKRAEKREYTLMIVPHHGQGIKSLRFPVKAIKFLVAALCIFSLMVTGVIINYKHLANAAVVEKSELQNLRQVNEQQRGKLEQLAQATIKLQEDMERLNNLDRDVRKLVNENDDSTTTTSRANVTRIAPTVASGGEGGSPAGASPATRLEQITNAVEELKAASEVREKSLSNLKEALVVRNEKLAATPSIKPAGGTVTSRFGWRGSPFGYGADFHPGLDIANDMGTPIVATADGVVAHADWYGGYGKLVKIEHGNGIQTLYGHNSQLAVSEGQKVKKGQVIAYMGSTGLSTGSHCHYEIRVNGTAVDPAKYL